jgi:hypothetical protein
VTRPAAKIPAPEVIRPPSEAISTGLSATAGKLGKIPVHCCMAGENAVGSACSGFTGQIIPDTNGLFRARRPSIRPDELFVLIH